MGANNKMTKLIIAVVALCSFAIVSGEAEASADASALYGHYGYGHLGYAYHRFHGYPYNNHYGHFYGKRSAEADPEAAADAHYGHYGYGHGHYGHHAYGHQTYGLNTNYGFPYRFHAFHH